MNIVLDTNCLIQILPRGSVNRWVFDALLQGQLTLSLTTEIVAEYEEVLNTFFESETLGANVCRTLLELPLTRTVSIYFNWQLITADPDDNKYVDCAVAANADFLITNDAHFKILEQIDFPLVTCISLYEFTSLFEKPAG